MKAKIDVYDKGMTQLKAITLMVTDESDLHDLERIARENMCAYKVTPIEEEDDF